MVIIFDYNVKKLLYGKNFVLVYHRKAHGKKENLPQTHTDAHGQRKKENLPQTHTDAHRQRGKKMEDGRIGSWEGGQRKENIKPQTHTDRGGKRWKMER